MKDVVGNKIREIRELLSHPIHRGHRFRGFIRYLRWNIGRRLLNDVNYAIRITPTVQVILSNRENYATLAYTCGLYDHQEMNFLLHYLRPGDVFGDFGANVGLYSVLAGSTGATVLSVEPVPETYERLVQNLRLNEVRGRAVRCGLSDAGATLRFTSARGGMNRVATAQDGHQTVEVEVVSPDTLVAETGLRPSVLKIDVEGFELPLLKGASTVLDDVVAIIVELNGSGAVYGHTDDAVHALLDAAGFACFDYASDSRELIPRESYRIDQFNSLYIKRDRIDSVRLRLAPSTSTSPRTAAVSLRPDR